MIILGARKPAIRLCYEERKEPLLPIALNELLASATDQLRNAGVPNPEVDAEVLIAFALDETRGRVQALALTQKNVDDEALSRIRSMLDRRAQREPLQHITGLAPFRHLELAVGPGVFVPRPETEWVTQFAIDELVRAGGDTSSRAATLATEPLRAVDLCTGSGAIALSIATELPHTRVWAVEKSEQAYRWATRNRESLGASNLTLQHGEVVDALPELDGTVTVVVSNPPYIPTGMIPRDPEVQHFDPHLALYGGEDGLDVVRQVSVTALRLLKPGGMLVIEHGEAQGNEICDLLVRDGWQQPATHQDLTGRDRATAAFRPA